MQDHGKGGEGLSRSSQPQLGTMTTLEQGMVLQNGAGEQDPGADLGILGHVISACPAVPMRQGGWENPSNRRNQWLGKMPCFPLCPGPKWRRLRQSQLSAGSMASSLACFFTVWAAWRQPSLVGKKKHHGPPKILHPGDNHLKSKQEGGPARSTWNGSMAAELVTL